MGKRAQSVTGKAPPAQRRKAACAAAAAVPVPPGGNALNARVQSMLGQCDSELKAHFPDLSTSLPTSASGVAPYDKRAAATQLGSGQPYICSIAWTWLDHAFELQPNVPKYASRLSNLQAHFFAEPKELPEPVEVHLNPGELPHDLIGSLQPVDAPELRDAMRMAIAQDIREGAGRKVMAQWRAILMSTVVKFKVVDDSNKVQQVFQTVVQRREDIGVRQENQGATSLMRVYEIQEFKRQLAGTNHQTNKTAVAEHYAKIKFAQRSEPVTSSFIEVASMLTTSVLSMPEVRDFLLDLDQNTFNPLNSVYKYRQVAILCEKKGPQMLWSFRMLYDRWLILDGSTSKEDGIPIRQLKADADCIGLVPLACGRSSFGTTCTARWIHDSSGLMT